MIRAHDDFDAPKISAAAYRLERPHRRDGTARSPTVIDDRL